MSISTHTLVPKATIGALVVVALAFFPTQAFARQGTASNARWHWIEVEASGASATGWAITSGTAIVRTTGKHFHADLQPDDDPGRTGISLDGQINNGQIRAKAVLLNTDASPDTVTGNLQRQQLGRDFVEERITFRGGQSGEGSFLGLYREERAASAEPNR